MGLNEMTVLRAVYSGNTHAQQIVESTHLNVMVVKACLVSLMRKKELQFNDGYQPYRTVSPPPKKSKPKMKYTKNDIPQAQTIEKILSQSPVPMSSQELARQTGFMNQCVRSCLSLMGRKNRVVAIGTGHRAKVYKLA